MVQTKLVVSISGGNVNGIFSNDPNAAIFVVDYDNLESDPSIDCSQGLPVGTLAEFRSFGTKDIRPFPGIAKLLKRFDE